MKTLSLCSLSDSLLGTLSKTAKSAQILHENNHLPNSGLQHGELYFCWCAKCLFLQGFVFQMTLMAVCLLTPGCLEVKHSRWFAMRAFHLSAWVTGSRAGGETGVCAFKRHLPFITALCGLLKDGAARTRKKKTECLSSCGREKNKWIQKGNSQQRPDWLVPSRRKEFILWGIYQSLEMT